MGVYRGRLACAPAKSVPRAARLRSGQGSSHAHALTALSGWKHAVPWEINTATATATASSPHPSPQASPGKARFHPPSTSTHPIRRNHHHPPQRHRAPSIISINPFADSTPTAQPCVSVAIKYFSITTEYDRIRLPHRPSYHNILGQRLPPPSNRPRGTA
jgi:hypothetical protein